MDEAPCKVWLGGWALGLREEGATVGSAQSRLSHFGSGEVQERQPLMGLGVLITMEERAGGDPGV